MQKTKQMYTSIAYNRKINKEMCLQNSKDKEEMKKVPYHNAIGCLMYAMLCTWPDISQVVACWFVIHLF